MTPLIQITDLQDRLQQPGPAPLLLDVRFNLMQPDAGEAAWRAGHLPGARHAHLDRDLSGTKTGRNGRHPLPTPADFEATARGWGLRAGQPVVVYDDHGGMFAARLWWLLRWLGHDAVQVLDGGWSAWVAAGGAVDTRVPDDDAPGADWRAHPRAGWVRTADEVWQGVRGERDQCLIDARAPDRFRGENETLDPVGGHIPGARNRFFQGNLIDGRFKPAEALRAEWQAVLGNAPLDTVVHQCGSGVTACHNLLAMAVAGFAPTALYGGSWSEWCADPARPTVAA